MFTVSTPETVVMRARVQLERDGRQLAFSHAFADTAAELAALKADDRLQKGRRIHSPVGPDRNPDGISAEADPARNQLTTENAFHITLRNRRGDLQAFGSVRCLQVGPEMLSGFLGQWFSRLYGNGAPAIHVKSLPHVTDRASGRILFLSNLYVGSNIIGKIDVGPLALAGIGEGVRRFNPDHVCGFARHRDMIRGLAARYLCTGTYPGAVRWRVDTTPCRDDDWLLFMNRDDYQYALGRFIDDRTA